MQEHNTHLVTTKVALYATDNSSVLVMRYPRIPRFTHGLPGGHIDGGESPDEAIARELQEELGLTNLQLEHKDFFRYVTGKIVLGFIGRISKDTPLNPPNPEKEFGVWLTRDELEQTDIEDGYKKFALKFWPAN